MAKQVGIAQDLRDEEAAIAVLAEVEPWSALPRFLDAPPKRALELGACGAADQVIFPKRISATVLARVQPVADASGRFHVYPKAGVCIEWDRTQRQANGFLAGRFFFERHEDGDASVEKAFDRLNRWIRRTSCARIAERFPVFVGSSLFAAVSAGKERIVFPNGRIATLTVER